MWFTLAEPCLCSPHVPESNMCGPYMQEGKLSWQLLSAFQQKPESAIGVGPCFGLSTCTHVSKYARQLQVRKAQESFAPVTGISLTGLKMSSSAFS